jgi:predicted nucleic-acid-binding protein
MLGVDTNVVIRPIISDDAEQTRRARKLVEQALSHDEPLLVSLLVLLESEWVLRSRYGFNREALLSIFRALLAALRLPSMAKRLGCPALYRSNVRVTRVAEVEFDSSRGVRSVCVRS